MSSLFDEIFGSGGVKDNPLDTLAALMAIKEIADSGVTVIEAKITTGGTRTEAKVGGRKDVMEEIGVLEDVEAFAEEIRPIMKKYSKKITEKYEAFVTKDPEKAAHKMAKWIVEENLQTRR